jgi:predicted nucleotidyltransferase
MRLPNSSERPTITIVELADILGISERSLRAHLADLPDGLVLRVGHRLIVSTTRLHAWLGAESTDSEGPAATAGHLATADVPPRLEQVRRAAG